MEGWMKQFALIVLVLFMFVGLGCGKDEKSTADRDAEIKKALQEGAQKEQKMYEGMQKGVENLEKTMKEQKEKSK
ncbi:MAG: hypothetical protein E6J89_06955 [Deltaproteobacteria bacterium]|nr:MAG: hypothetical protein E6J89_06955 [Deltaproteobacteria bacterium]